MRQRICMGIVAFDVNLSGFFVVYSTGYCQMVVIILMVQMSDTMNILQKIFYGNLNTLLKSLSDNEQTLRDSLQDY